MIAFAIDRLTIRVEGLRPDEEREFLAQWGRFRIAEAGDPWIDVRITHRQAFPEPFDAKALRVRRSDGSSDLAMPGLRATVPDAGPLTVER